MKIIVPMAGMGKRMRPHTLTVPKPLIPIAGKPIVQRLMEEIAAVVHQPIEEIAFVVGHFGEAVENSLISIAEALGAKGSIYYQDEPLGTAHAILCASPALDGPVTVAFADTLFKAEFELDQSKDGVLFVQQIDDPSQFGVVQLDANNNITAFVEKPTEFVSDLAMIGIYYFKDGANLREELQWLIDNKVIKSGEYQLPDALRNMTEKGKKFGPGQVTEWLDCGNKDATVYTNQRILEHLPPNNLVAASVDNQHSVVIPPCYIGENVVLKNAVVGPHVSIGNGTKIENSVVSNSIIQSNSDLCGVSVTNSMIGNAVRYHQAPASVSIGDYTTLDND